MWDYLCSLRQVNNFSTNVLFINNRRAALPKLCSLCQIWDIRLIMLAANNWNVCQYAVLVHMFARVSGLKAGELVHVIADAHIYDRHIPIIEKMLAEPEHPAPQFTLDPAVTNFYAFTPDSVRLENYQFSPFEDKIPIAV